MFSKILIANRGEIACRVMDTARRMGVGTVAVYSDADANARHARMADEAVRLGPAPVSESYLRGDAIIEAALATGAEAIHPGYGFLSENPDFVEAVQAAGLVFIGPPARAIRAMGLKDAAKALMEEAGVPVVPGYHGEEQDPSFLAKEADSIGYPVLIKARAGGGGKGMRLVEAPGAFRSALEGAMREAQSSFGDPACLVEKFVTQPRHIEIQVFGDSHGNVVHLFERDCSLQRRHQKVIEEAPAPDMPEDVRAAMGAAAVNAARAIGYQGAGTVEFIVDGSDGLTSDGFWFMEMNTRLQVEHPVTEAITGLDLVELQLRVASGEALPFDQSELSINGHSFEARIYAEDVPAGFLPAIGRLDHLSFPEFARIDTGVEAGDEITPFYDPMIAKLIVHGSTRSEALGQLSRALGATEIAGSVTNLEFLGALSRHQFFARGEVDTGLIARDLDALTVRGAVPHVVLSLAALSSLGFLDQAASPFRGWQHWGQGASFVSLLHEGGAVEGQVVPEGTTFDVTLNGTRSDYVVEPARKGLRITADGRIAHANVVRFGARITVFMSGRAFEFEVPDAGRIDDDAGGGDRLIAPMPGLVKLVSIKSGEDVKQGDTLMVLEAMKMEHTLTAPRDGVVVGVHAKEGDQVSDGVVLLELEEVT